MDDYQLRPITDDEYHPFLRCFEKAFGKDHHADEATLERDLVELPRTLAAFDERDGVVGTALSYGRELGVPGGTLPAAHVSLVSVAGTHRRRGLLRRLMARQLSDLCAAGTEPVAVLWASEEAIYGRFGYGPATATVSYQADTREVTVPPGPPAGRLREIEFAEATETLSVVFDAARAGRPGISGRSGALWKLWQADLEHWRDGHSGMRAVVHEGVDGPDGYALFRIQRDSDATGPNATVHVEEMVATDLAGYQELWRFLFTIDLTRRVEYDFAALDEPLQYLVTERRRLGARLGDGLWLRILDLPTALTSRRYATDLDVVLEVTDDLLGDNAGRWHLWVDSSGASCERTDTPADLALSVAQLGAVYLGGTSLSALAAAGHVQELHPDSLAPTSTAFGWHRAPTSIEIF